MARFRLRPGVRQWVAIVAALCTAVVVVALYRQKLRADEWRGRSVEFVEQVNALGEKLEPGGSGVIHVTAGDADELILLPAYSTREALGRSLPGRPPALLERLYEVSGDGHTSPALVWLRGERILSINPAKFTVGLNLTPHSWALRERREIRVTQEAQSPNPFLSLFFHDDSENPGIARNMILTLGFPELTLDFP